MPSRARRAVPALVGVLGLLGALLAVLGLWFAVRLGPSGTAEATVTTPASGGVEIPARYVNSVDVPFEVTARRADAGPVWVGVATQGDADLLLAGGTHSVVTDLNALTGSAELRSTGSGPLTGVTSADIWRSTASADGRARLLVPQTGEPTVVVVASGDPAPLRDLTLTLRWSRGVWFAQALLAAVVGAVVATAAVVLLSRSRRSRNERPADERTPSGDEGPRTAAESDGSAEVPA